MLPIGKRLQYQKKQENKKNILNVILNNKSSESFEAQNVYDFSVLIQEWLLQM